MINLGKASNVSIIDGFTMSNAGDDGAVLYVELFSVELGGDEYVIVRFYRHDQFNEVLYKAEDFVDMLDSIKDKVKYFNK